MTDPVSRVQLENANLDCATLAEVVNGDDSPGTLTSRLGTSLKTVAKIVKDLSEQDIGESAAAIINANIASLTEQLSLVEAKVNSFLSSSLGPDPLLAVSGAMVWRADALGTVTRSGSDVSQWNEQFSGVKNFVFSSNKPSWHTNGGPGNGPMIQKDSGENFLIGSGNVPVSGSPYSIYGVVRTPTIIDNAPIIYTGSRSGNMGYQYSSAVSPTKGAFYYTGEDPYYSNKLNAIRTTWQLVAIHVKDSNSMWIEINDEPITYKLDTSAGSTSTILDFGCLYNGGQVAMLAVVPGVSGNLQYDTHALAIRKYYTAYYGLQAPTHKLILIGDSHAAGVQSGTGTGLPFWLNLDQAGVTVYNFGVSGAAFDTNNGSYDYPDIHASHLLEDFKDYHIAFCYGTNDALTASGGYGWTSWANWKASIKAKLQAYIDLGYDPAKMAIILPPNNDASGYASIQPNLGTYVVPNLTAIASELGMELIDWYGGTSSIQLGYGDGLHGNNAAHEVASDLILAWMGV